MKKIQKRGRNILILFILLLSPSLLISQEVVKEFTRGLMVPLEGRYARDAVFQDELLYQLITGSFSAPEAGAVCCSGTNQDTLIWEAIEADNKGWFQHRHLRGGYLFLSYESSRKEQLVLHINGHAEVYVNGEPRAGDVYGYGWVEHPVDLHRGQNTILVRGSRGRVQAALIRPQTPVYLSQKDLLMPDLVRGDMEARLGAIRVINCRTNELRGLTIQTWINGEPGPITEVPVVGKLTSRKVPFQAIASPSADPGTCQIAFQLTDGRGRILSSLSDQNTIAIKEATDKRKETFISSIDGSVQYYSVVPPDGGQADSLALFLSLHGASVEAVNQANAYSHKTWGTLVAPTNRRPYGFDWEDWGRWDAMEVLSLAKARYRPDPDRIYLTGHSMGGHGTWHLGVTFPGLWAAIAPSAGWYSFWSYAGKETGSDDPAGQFLDQAANGSHTLALSQNYLNHGIYILHGDQDDNVPVDQARFMRSHLAGFHTDFCYYERSGAGHWWGNECVDWPPLFDFFKSHSRLPVAGLRSGTFTSASPGISSTFRHLEIIRQEVPLSFSNLEYRFDQKDQKMSIQTTNVEAMAVDLRSFTPNQPIDLVVDELPFKVSGGPDQIIILDRTSGTWVQKQAVDPELKHPGRSGLFKDAFRNRMVFVYGTSGTREENDWSYAKARFDAETFWYRGNGSVDVISDQEFLSGDYSERNVILFGHADMNAAWNLLLADCPIQVSRKRLKVGEHLYQGEDYAAYFIYPRPGSSNHAVGVVAGTGLTGLRSAYPNRYFVSGSGFPDFLLYQADLLRKGSEAVVSAGYFDNQWKLSPACSFTR